MSEEEKRWNKRDKPTYIMVPRKFMIAIVMAFLSLLIGVASSVQWANYINRKSNQRWCGIVVTFDNINTKTPPLDDVGKAVAIEFRKLRNEFNCN